MKKNHLATLHPNNTKHNLALFAKLVKCLFSFNCLANSSSLHKKIDMEETQLLHTNISTTFRHDVIKELLKSKFSNPKNKMTDDTVELIAELAKAMVIEAAARACYQANLEDKTTVTLDHVECTLPQLMLDFP